MRNQDRYKTILVMVVGLLVLSIAFKTPVISFIAIGIGVLSIASSFAAKWIEWLWLKLALALGWINSRILLSILFFVFLLPIAWISKLFTKDPLLLKGRQLASLYSTRDHLYTKEDLENIW
ncbi:MAG TPA: SxtJ family membrane protein [Cyclobacteriaceae bacterium]